VNRFKGILFDFDGTLANTLGDHFLAWQAVMKNYSVDLKPKDYYPLEGIPMPELAKRFMVKAGDDSPTESLIKDLVKQKENYYLQHHRFEFYPGVESFVDTLWKTGILIAIVTASYRDRMRKSVPGDFLDKFNALVDGKETLRGKPHPDPYLKGAEALRLDPAQCIVIENAPLGVESAKNAGAYCIAVCSTLDRSSLRKADEVVSAFSELASLGVIRNLLRGSPKIGRL